MLKLYSYWRSLAAYRVRIALSLKAIPVEIVTIDLLAGQQHQPDYKAINPQMTVPALIEEDGAVLFQSMAILEYLEERHPCPPLLPHDSRARARVRGLSQILVADTHPLLVPRVRSRLAREYGFNEEQVVLWGKHWIEAGLAAVETHLARDPETGQFCHGDTPGLADICLYSQAAGSVHFKADVNQFPTVARIVARCAQVAAFANTHPSKQPDAPKTS